MSTHSFLLSSGSVVATCNLKAALFHLKIYGLFKVIEITVHFIDYKPTQRCHYDIVVIY
jgi:hypothetical protein